MPKLFNKLKSAASLPVSGEKLLINAVLTDKALQVALLAIAADGNQLKEFSKVKTYFDRKDLADQLDQALQELGPESEEVTETVFTFASSWMDETDLKETKKVIVKDVSEQLSLEAVGQLSIPQAIASSRLIADKHDSSLLIFLEEENFDLILIKHGELLATVNVGRSAKIADDLQEGLARITAQVGEEGKYFPNKLFLSSLVLKEKELAKEQSELQAFDWSNFAGFLQVPEVVVLESDYLIKASTIAANLDNQSQVKAAKVIDNVATPSASVASASASEAPASAGEADDQFKPDDNLQPIEAEQLTDTDSAASSFGIAIDQDLIKEKLLNKAIEKKVQHFSEIAVSEKVVKQKNKKRSKLARFLLKNKKGVLIGAGSGLLALLVLFTVFAVFLATFTIAIVPDRQLLQKKVAVTLDPNLKESDFEKYLLKASLESKELTGEDVLNTTGISLVGEKAKGKVKIFNKSSSEETLEAGTIVSYEDINFTLDEEVKVASATEKVGGSGVDYGQAEVAVTAKDIGAEANLNKETKLRVADYYDDTFSAQSVEDFSGGSSREIRVVSPEDIIKLAQNLKQVLIADAKEEFAADSKDGAYFIPTGTSKTLTANYSHEEGEEVEALSLELTLEVEAIKYLSEDLKKLAIEVLKQDLPENYQFVDQEPELMSDKAQEASNSAQIKIDTELSAKAEPIFDQAALIETIKGQEIETALSNLTAKSEIKAASLRYQPSFLLKVFKKFPNDSKRINLVIEN